MQGKWIFLPKKMFFPTEETLFSCLGKFIFHTREKTFSFGRNFRDTAGAGTSLFLLEHNPESGQTVVIGTERVGAAVHLEDFANKD